MSLNINFYEMLGKNELVDQLAKDECNNTHAILWYVGMKGLPCDGAAYYKKMFKKFMDVKCLRKIYLYDLMAWNAFKNRSSKLSDEHNDIRKVEDLTSSKFIGMPSSLFFEWLNEDDICMWIQKNILVRDDIYKVSDDYEKSNIPIKQIFGDAGIVKSIENLDCGKSYSAFQYFEIIYLLWMIATADDKDKMRVCFVLPNDETKYYKFNFLKDDIESFLKFKNINKNIVVDIISFQYGNKIGQRPYNAGQARTNNITKDMLPFKL